MSRAIQQLLSTFVSLLLIGSSAFGQSVSVADSPPASTESPATLNEVEAATEIAPHHLQARGELVDACQRLDAFLQKYSSQDENSWKTFLDWVALREQLESPEPNPSVLDEIEVGFYRNQVGLERVEFTDVRDAIRKYSAAVRFVLADNSDWRTSQHLELLTRYLESCESGTPLLDTDVVADSVGWLEAGGLHPDLTRSVRSLFVHPNATILFDGDAINYVVERELTRTSPVEEFLFGASVTGSAETKGVISTDLDEEAGDAFDLVIKAIVTASTDSTRRNISVHSHSKTHLEARKSIGLDEFGVHTKPAEASATTETLAANVYARMRLIRRLASRRVRSLQPQAETLASQRAAEKLEEELDTQIDQQLEAVNRFWREKLREPAMRVGVFPSLFRTQTRDNRLQFDFRMANRNQFGAPTPPPSEHKEHDFSFSGHESAFNNTTGPLLAGKTVTDEDLSGALQKIFGTVPRPFRLGSHLERWSLVLASDRPVKVSFDDNTVTMAVTVQSFQIGERHVEFPVVVTGVYQPEITRFSFGFSLRKHAPVTYERPGGAPFGKEDAEMLEFVKTKFDAFYLDEFGFESMSPPAGGVFEKLTNFKLKRVIVDEGWFMIGGDRTAVEPSAPSGSE